jgi:hypothetical protein
MARIFARTLSFTVQSIDAFFLTASTSSKAICRNVWIPQDFHCGIVHFECIIESDFLIAHLELIAPTLGFAHVL